MEVVTPPMLEDSRRIMESYGQEGSFDPFKLVYEVRISVVLISLDILNGLGYSSLSFSLQSGACPVQKWQMMQS